MAIHQPITRGLCADCGMSICAGALRCKPCDTAKRRARSGRYGPRSCVGCGVVFVPKRTRNAGRYCSRECAFSDPAMVAENVERLRALSTALAPRREFKAMARRAVAATVLSIKRAIRAANIPAPTAVKCRCCGKAIPAKPSGSGRRPNHCSLPCLEWSKRKVRKKLKVKHGRNNQDRARVRGLPVESNVGPISVCNRDGWHCRICGISTPRRLRGTCDWRAPEVDHIVPSSDPRSPGHVWSNVQCLCRRCNLTKASRTIGQLRISFTDNRLGGRA